MKLTNRTTCVITSVLFFVVSGWTWAEQFDASLVWSKRVAVSTPVTGVIQDVFVDAGERVAQGDKMLQLDDEVFKARLTSAKADAKNRIEEYKEAQREVERMQELYDRTMLSEHDLQVAKNNLIRAKAEKEKADARHVSARYDLKYSTVRAPFNALVLERLAQPGQVISANLKPETLLVIAEADKILARITVAEQWLTKLKKGQQVRVNVTDKNYTGKIIAIGLEPQVTGSGGKTGYPVDIEFNTENQLLRAGQQAKVSIE